MADQQTQITHATSDIRALEAHLQRHGVRLFACVQGDRELVMWTRWGVTYRIVYSGLSDETRPLLETQWRTRVRTVPLLSKLVRALAARIDKALPYPLPKETRR